MSINYHHIFQLFVRNILLSLYIYFLKRKKYVLHLISKLRGLHKIQHFILEASQLKYNFLYPSKFYTVTLILEYIFLIIHQILIMIFLFLHYLFIIYYLIYFLLFFLNYQYDGLINFQIFYKPLLDQPNSKLKHLYNQNLLKKCIYKLNQHFQLKHQQQHQNINICSTIIIHQERFQEGKVDFIITK